MRQAKSGGGWQAVRYGLRKARELGPVRFWKAMSSNNACKTCALGMGGQLGGMRNEAGRFPEVCKKSFQAMAADMQGRIDPEFFRSYSLAQLQSLTSRELEMCGRIADPLLLESGDTHFRVISWEEAFSRAAQALRSAEPDRSFFYCSGRSSNEAGFLLNLLARGYGTNHLSNCSYYCHQASGVGLGDSLGMGTSTVALEDVEECDTLFLIGGNPASNHPRLMTLLMRIRARGGRVIVVNPAKETGLINFKVPSNPKSMLFGTEIASRYLQPKIGGDIAIFVGIAKWLIEQGRVDESFIRDHTEGFQEVRDLAQDTSWETLERSSGLSREEISGAAEDYASSQKTIFSWTMGITHHEHGVENVQWIVNLALMRGMIGKPGAGVMPIRGHSNVQGLGSIGVSPKLKEAAIQRLADIGIPAPAGEGLDTLATMELAHEGGMAFGLCLGGNLYGANPDATYAAEALGRVDTLIYMNTTLNTGHVRGLGKDTLVLPVLARDEEPQSTTQESMFNYVRLSDGGPARHSGPKSEVEVLADIGKRVLVKSGEVDWSTLVDHDRVRELIARLVPGFEEIKDIGESKREFHLPGRILHTPVFSRPNGRAAFRAHAVPAIPELAPDEFLLMTVRSEGQFNSVVYEEYDIYRGQERRDVILLNASNMKRLGLQDDDLVTVSSEAGEMCGILARHWTIATDCALMYYPEANVLVPRTRDPRSKTPAFKAVRIRVVKENRRGEKLSESTTGASSARQRMNAC